MSAIPITKKDWDTVRKGLDRIQKKIDDHIYDYEQDMEALNTLQAKAPNLAGIQYQKLRIIVNTCQWAEYDDVMTECVSD